ncbi:MAG: hypothetical protein DWQ01_17615 [Planctomycetota bacterium]|nr:MAG: hypothetical protein DWQ01_17615 [Planctomycetota bacterium]
MMKEIKKINAALAPLTVVHRMEFKTNLESGKCSLVLELVDDDIEPIAGIILEAGLVSDFWVKGFGGGVTQILCLRVRDVRHLQHDGVKYVLEDLENQAFNLKCMSLIVRKS